MDREAKKEEREKKRQRQKEKREAANLVKPPPAPFDPTARKPMDKKDKEAADTDVRHTCGMNRGVLLSGTAKARAHRTKIRTLSSSHRALLSLASLTLARPTKRQSRVRRRSSC